MQFSSDNYGKQQKKTLCHQKNTPPKLHAYKNIEKFHTMNFVIISNLLRVRSWEVTRPELTPSDVQAYIMGHFGLPSGSFTVHVHHPEDFLVLFHDYDVLHRILDAPLPSSV
jgi:hypothetical protein